MLVGWLLVSLPKKTPISWATVPRLGPSAPELLQLSIRDAVGELVGQLKVHHVLRVAVSCLCPSDVGTLVEKHPEKRTIGEVMDNPPVAMVSKTWQRKRSNMFGGVSWGAKQPTQIWQCLDGSIDIGD